MMKSTRFEGDDQDLAGRIDEFMKRFKLGTLLSRAGIRKVRGGSPLLILRTIFELAFVGRNVYTEVHNRPTALSKRTLSTDFSLCHNTTGAGSWDSCLLPSSNVFSNH